MNKITLFIALAILNFGTNAQNTMYFMESMPQKQIYNPALIPEVDFYLSLPGLNGASVHAYNSGFNYNELDDFMDGLDRQGYNPDEFINSIGKTNRFASEAKASLFGFGFKAGEKAFFSFNILSNQSITFDADSEMAYLLSDFDDIEASRFPIVVDNVNINVNSYTKMGFTYTRRINDRLTIGINPNINSSHAGIKTNNLRYVVEIESIDQYGYREYNETFDGEVLLGLPTEINQEAITGTELDLEEGILPENWDEDLKVSDLINNQSFSIDLGATYQLQKWDFSASLLNIGANKWSTNGYRLKGNEDVIHVYDEKINIGIPPQIFLGASRQFSPRWNYALLFQNSFYPGKSMASATLSLNGAVGKMLSTSVSYTAGYKFDNLGLGLRLRFFPGMDLFVVTDNFVQALSYKKAYRFSGAVGINFSFGVKNHLPVISTPPPGEDEEPPELNSEINIPTDI